LGYIIWDNSDKAALLVPFSLGYIGWRILRHSRGWAILLGIVLAGMNVVGLFASEIPYRVEVELIGWCIWILLLYGCFGAIAYRRIAAQKLFGLDHDDVVQQTKTAISVGFGTCCCLLLLLGIARFTKNLGQDALLSLTIMPIVLVAFIEPPLEYLRDWL